MNKQLQEKLDHLIELTKQKDISSIQTYLSSADTQLKGSLFESFLKLLFEGNGWLTQHVGRSGESSADILLFHPTTPTHVQLIVQAKNHNRPLTWDETITELTKFEKLGSKKYNCNNFWILSISGFVSEAKKLCEFNLDLKSWNYVEELIREYNPEKIKQPKLTLFPHNEEAYKSIVETWKTKKKVAIVQATGTGKSFLIAKILADDLQKKKLMVAPQSYILTQQKSRIPWANDNVVYRTYHKLIWCSDEELQELKPDIIFLDEFHRCGADEWGSAITRLLKIYPDAYVLGTSATPIRYLDQSRDMAEELFEGNVPVRISIADAIKKKILPAPKYISSLYQIDTEGNRLIEQVKGSNRTDSEKQKLLQKVENAKIEWKQSAGVPVVLNKHLPHDVTKMIVFCEDNAHLNQMRSMFIQWFVEAGITKNINQYVVTRHNSARDEELERFKSAKPKKDQLHVLFSINMLNEGIHVEDVAAVFLMRKTESPRLFYQQIGRCIQTNAQQTPIIFDLVNNFRNIRAIDFKKDLDEAERRLNDRRFTFGLPMTKVPVSIVDETRNVVQTFEDIEAKLENWETKFDLLCEFIQIRGHSHIRRGEPKYFVIGQWVNMQRIKKRRGTLSDEKIIKLNNANFSWDPGEEKWIAMFEKLREYYFIHGNCLVPNPYPPDKALGRWVSHLRFSKKNFTTYQKEKLNLINFFDQSSVKKNIVFNEGLNLLDKYIQIHKNSNVPQTGKFRRLGRWVNFQRVKKKSGKLFTDQIAQLEQRGFLWEAREILNEKRFDERVAELKAYKEKVGDFKVPYKYPENKALYNWYNKLLRKRPAPERYNKLLTIGFDWEAETKK